ncbi:MAG: uncharacterized protein Dbin4_02382 [Alphaproteobacteria bacterium]|nr:uncharacterized protein [Alphaproteobacteria bacterium]
MFKRRTKRSPLQKARELVWPSSGYRRASLYLWRRLMRLNAPPHRVALGFAIGVFISFSPFLGLHLALSGLFAWLLRVNVAASLLGNFLGNPVTYPFMWACVYQTGILMLGESHTEGGTELALLSFNATTIQELFLPFLIGSIPVGILAGLAFYFPVKKGVENFQAARRARFVKTHPTLAAGAIPSHTSEAL